MNGQDGVSRDLQDTSPAGAQAPRGDDQAPRGDDRAPCGVQPAAFARLKERSEFLAVAKGARMHEAAFTLQAIAREAGEPARRFGLTVTKKTGNSVVRNRIRRRIREALRTSGIARDEVADGAARDYVIVARRDALSRDFAGLKHDIATLVKRVDKRLASKPGAPEPRDKPRSKPAT